MGNIGIGYLGFEMGLISLKRCNAILFGIFCTVFVTHAGDYTIEPIKYINHQDSQVVTINFDEGTYDNGHLVFHLSLCPSDSKYICMFGGLPFAIPRNLNGKMNEWVVNDHKFYNLGQQEIKLAGKYVPVYRIEYHEKGGTMWYQFSDKYGLVSFGYLDKNSKKTTYIIESECGFGANYKCITHDNKPGRLD